MCGQEYHRTFGVEACGHELGIVDSDPLLDRLGACTEAPKCFHQRIRQIAVGTADDCSALGPVSFRKRVRDIVLRAIAPPMHEIKGHEIHQCAKRVEHRQGHAGQRPEKKLHRDQATATSRSSVSGCFNSSSLAER